MKRRSWFKSLMGAAAFAVAPRPILCEWELTRIKLNKTYTQDRVIMVAVQKKLPTPVFAIDDKALEGIII